MPTYIVNIIGGDFKPDMAAIVTGGFTERFKKIAGLKKKGSLPIPFIGKEKLKANHIKSVELLTAENSTSVLGKAAWATAGALTLGGAGLVAGAVGGGNKATTQAVVNLKDGRTFLIKGKSKAINFLAQAPYI